MWAKNLLKNSWSYMGTLEIENISFELRKINAIKISGQSEESKKNISEKKLKEKSMPAEIKFAFEQKQDKGKINLYALYTIPSHAEYDLEIDAEFKGLIFLKEPFDIEKEQKDSPIMNEFIRKKVLPKITNEMDKVLFPIFKNMNVKYECLFKKPREDIGESKNNTQK